MLRVFPWLELGCYHDPLSLALPLRMRKGNGMQVVSVEFLVFGGVFLWFALPGNEWERAAVPSGER